MCRRLNTGHCVTLRGPTHVLRVKYWPLCNNEGPYTCVEG